MKVHELIKLLKRQDPSDTVIVANCEEGYDMVKGMSRKGIKHAVGHEFYEGAYTDGGDFDAVYLSL